MTQAPGLTRTQIAAMAVAAALSVANLYYAQPLLGLIARDLGVPEASVGLLPTLTQAGYASGLLFIVPLGDVLDRRRMVLAALGLVALALAGTVLARGVTGLAVASYAVGVTTIAPQLIFPLAAALAPEGERGRVLGTIMGGLLVGILSARTVAGLVGDLFGWRAIFAIAAGLMVLLALVMAPLLPTTPRGDGPRLGYGQLLASLVTLVREQPVLREAAVLGGLGFAAFSAFWSTLVFLLERAPYHYGSRGAGAFGLIGIAGALAASIAGRIGDRRGPRFTSGVAMAVAFASFLLFWALPRQLWALCAGVLVLDVGTQANQVSNQARIYALLPEARNRVNTVYMTSYFVGGALGTTAGTMAWARFGWSGVCVVGLVTLGLALVRYAVGTRAERTRAAG